MTNLFPKLHNAMWPGLVGKGDEEGQEPPISLQRMLELTAAAEVDGQKFEGVDYVLFHPHRSRCFGRRTERNRRFNWKPQSQSRFCGCSCVAGNRR